MLTMNGEANSTVAEPTENTPELSNNVSCENDFNGIGGDNSTHSEDAENGHAENGHTDSQQIETKCPSPFDNAVKSDDELPTKEIEECNVQESANNGLDSSHSNSNDSLQSEEDALNQTDPETQDKEDTLNVNEPKIQEKDDTEKDQLNDTGAKLETFEIVNIEKHHSDDEVESVNSLDDSDSDMAPRAHDAVSLDSDSDDHNSPNSSVIIIDGSEKHNGKSDISSEVLVIGSDNENDCVISSDDKLDKNKTKTQNASKKSKKKTNNTNVELRRSSRTIKRRKYSDVIETLDDDESDIEEVFMRDQVTIKSSKVSKINNGKQKSVQNNMDTFVIIDSPVKSKPHAPILNKTTSSFNQAIYQTIVSRGTSVTPVSAKNVVKPNIPETQVAPAPPPQPILPTLSDDMFVVEAPSFIVPYVYEKPAKVPFKEYLETLGKQIKEENAKIEQALLEKKKAEKEKRQQERQERRERGEEVPDSEEEGPVPPAESASAEEHKKTKAENKEKRRRKRDDDDVSWDGSSSSESDDTITDDEAGNVVILKDKVDDLVELKTASEVPPDTTTKTNSYFDLNLGKFFMDIGENLVQEFVQADLLKQQNRKFQREKKKGHSTTNRAISIALLTKNLEMSQKTNKIYTFEQKKCKFCTFKTESQLAMAHHLETPHMKNNLYRCNFCEFEIKTPHDILYHMESKHGVKGRLERALSTHQCANCPFEDHGKGKLARHLVACAKRFKPETNLAPPIEWEHPAKIAKLARNRNSMTPYQVSQFGRNHVDGSMKMGIPIVDMPENKVKNRGFGATRLNLPMPVRPAGIPIRPAIPAHSSNFNVAKKMPSSLSITPVPRQITPPAMQMSNQPNAKGFVICEICDGYIKDLELLRNHMQWIHKVKIHPKMIYNRPPLNCQKCQFRFFTDQGLERHLLGSHGLVTSSMQEAANKGKDAGRCPVCGKVYQWKLLSHVSRDHNLTLKPAHLSYKCTVCTATFGMYRQFENHVYSVHSVVAKKVMDKNTTKPKTNDGKQLKISDEITVTPQPVKVPVNKK